MTEVTLDDVREYLDEVRRDIQAAEEHLLALRVIEAQCVSEIITRTHREGRP
jgi:hypothetical protein